MEIFEQKYRLLQSAKELNYGKTTDAKSGEGLVTAIAVYSREMGKAAILMVAFANRQAVEITLATGRATYYSRSRQEIWVKGEGSGNTQDKCVVYADCDMDAILYDVEPMGPACCTNARSCFELPIDTDNADMPKVSRGGVAIPSFPPIRDQLRVIPTNDYL